MAQTLIPPNVARTEDTVWSLAWKRLAAALRDEGKYGCVVETGTTAVTSGGSPFFAIQMLEDTVFSLLTDTGATGDAMTGFTISAGQVIYGNFTAFTLTSGKVRAYRSY